MYSYSVRVSVYSVQLEASISFDLSLWALRARSTNTLLCWTSSCSLRLVQVLDYRRDILTALPAPSGLTRHNPLLALLASCATQGEADAFLFLEAATP